MNIFWRIDVAVIMTELNIPLFTNGEHRLPNISTFQWNSLNSLWSRDLTEKPFISDRIFKIFKVRHFTTIEMSIETNVQHNSLWKNCWNSQLRMVTDFKKLNFCWNLISNAEICRKKKDSISKLVELIDIQTVFLTAQNSNVKTNLKLFEKREK